MTEVVNAVVEAADVDLGKGALLMALKCPDGESRRISVRMQDDPGETIPHALGARFLTQVQGRAVRVKLDGDTVQDVGHFIEDRWLVGDRPQEPTEAEQCEKDRRNEHDHHREGRPALPQDQDLALRVRGVRLRDVHGFRGRADRVPLRARAEVEVPAMADGCPLVPCSLCDLVPGRPDRREDGSWRIVCPICGREAVADFEADVRGEWMQLNSKPPAPLSPALELLDSIEAAMCDLEAIRTVPGAMTAWQRWMDDLAELRRIVKEAEASC